MNTILQANNFIYKQIPVKKFKIEGGYFISYCEYLICDKNNDKFHFLLRTHDKIEIISFENYDTYFYITTIINVAELIKFLDIMCKNQKIIKLNTHFLILNNDNINTFTTSVFKINNEKELIINFKFYDNLISKQVNKDEILNNLYTIEEIIKYKTQC